MTRHFLDLDRVDAQDLRHIIDAAQQMKAAPVGATPRPTAPLAGKALAMIFEKPSTRTRVSFERAIQQLGGEAIVLQSSDMQLGRGETIEDTARVLSRYVDAIMIRAQAQSSVLTLAEAASVPVINGLTDFSHPCQIMATVMTFEAHRGAIKGQKLAWVGDGNNVSNSLIHAAERFDFTLEVATPEALMPDASVRAWAKAQGAAVRYSQDPQSAVKAARAVVTDTWVSMGDADAANRHNLLKSYQVDASLMARAAPDALFMHCLPAHRGEEVSAEVIDGPQSVVFDEAENRLHAQKAILAWCLGTL